MDFIVNVLCLSHYLDLLQNDPPSKAPEQKLKGVINHHIGLAFFLVFLCNCISSVIFVKPKLVWILFFLHPPIDATTLTIRICLYPWGGLDHHS